MKRLYTFNGKRKKKRPRRRPASNGGPVKENDRVLPPARKPGKKDKV